MMPKRIYLNLGDPMKKLIILYFLSITASMQAPFEPDDIDTASSKSEEERSTGYDSGREEEDSLKSPRNKIQSKRPDLSFQKTSQSHTAEPKQVHLQDLTDIAQNRHKDTWFYKESRAKKYTNLASNLPQEVQKLLIDQHNGNFDPSNVSEETKLKIQDEILKLNRARKNEGAFVSLDNITFSKKLLDDLQNLKNTIDTVQKQKKDNTEQTTSTLKSTPIVDASHKTPDEPIVNSKPEPKDNSEIPKLNTINIDKTFVNPKDQGSQLPPKENPLRERTPEELQEKLKNLTTELEELKTKEKNIKTINESLKHQIEWQSGILNGKQIEMKQLTDQYTRLTNLNHIELISKWLVQDQVKIKEIEAARLKSWVFNTTGYHEDNEELAKLKDNVKNWTAESQALDQYQKLEEEEKPIIQKIEDLKNQLLDPTELSNKISDLKEEINNTQNLLDKKLKKSKQTKAVGF
jgi:hypothetical protein